MALAFYILMAWSAMTLLVWIMILASNIDRKSWMSEEEKIAEFERDARETQEYCRAWLAKKEAKRKLTLEHAPESR